MYKNLGSRRIGVAFEAIAMIAAAIFLGNFFSFFGSLSVEVWGFLIGSLLIGALALAAAISDMKGKALSTLVLSAVSGGLALVTTLIGLIQFQGYIDLFTIIVDVIAIALAVYAFVALRNAQSKSPSSQPMIDGKSSSLKITGLVGVVLIGAGLISLLLSVMGWFVSLIPIIAGVQLIYIWVACAIADLAERKGRSWPLFFWLALLVSWVIMLIIAAAITPLGSASAPRNQAPAQPSTKGTDPGEQIRKLQKLKDDGLLTDAEFAEKKKELLARM